MSTGRTSQVSKDRSQALQEGRTGAREVAWAARTAHGDMRCMGQPSRAMALGDSTVATPAGRGRAGTHSLALAMRKKPAAAKVTSTAEAATVVSTPGAIPAT